MASEWWSEAFRIGGEGAVNGAGDMVVEVRGVFPHFFQLCLFGVIQQRADSNNDHKFSREIPYTTPLV